MKKVKARIYIDEDLSLLFLTRSGLPSIIVDGVVCDQPSSDQYGYLFVKQSVFTAKGLMTPKHKPETTEWFFQACEYEILEVVE